MKYASVFIESYVHLHTVIASTCELTLNMCVLLHVVLNLLEGYNVECTPIKDVLYTHEIWIKFHMSNTR